MDPTVVAYDPRWVSAFETERATLREWLRPWLVTDVEHVGSTAVPGLTAKPIIDMIGGVADLEVADGGRGVLAELGYTYRPHRPEAHLFVRVDPAGGLDTHHLHLTVPGSDLWVERLAFRDALRRDDALAHRYAAWKRAHATGDPRGAYGASKTPFVAEVLAACGVNLRPDHLRLPP